MPIHPTISPDLQRRTLTVQRLMTLLTFVAASGVVLSGSFFTIPASAGSVLDRVMNKSVVVNVTPPAYPPFSYMDDKNDIVGFDIDVAKEFARRLGVTLKVETPSWPIITAGNWQGRWDVCICSMTPTSARSQVLNFVTEYYATPATIVVNAGDERIRSAVDLTGRKVGVEAGSTYEQYLHKNLVIEQPGRDKVRVDSPFGKLTVVPYDSVETAFQDLGLGVGRRLDAIVTDILSAGDRIAQSNGKFKIVPAVLYAQPTWVAVDKGDREWEAKVREIFTTLAADGTLKAISIKWIGRDITVSSP